MSRGAGQELASLFSEYKGLFESNKRILPYEDYLALVAASPRRHCRDAATYLKDAFDHYGSYPVDRAWGQETRFALFDIPWDGGKDRLVGQERAQREVYNILRSFSHEGRVTRLVVLNGPNGSAKSTFVQCMMRALEDYSATDEGARYTFNWVFPGGRSSGSRIGFGGDAPARREGESYALLPDEDVEARLKCEVRDHPLLLLPAEQRLAFVKKALGDGAETHLPQLVERGGLCHKCKQIFEALLSAYKGDLAKVLQHVQVERWYVSRAYRRGAVTIGPQLSVDAGERQISADRSLAALPSSLQMTTLFEPHGELVDASGGILEFGDLLKRPLDAFRYLLSTIETGEVSLSQSILRLDSVLFATTNDLHLNAFREHPDYAAFRGRLAVVTVPYIRHYPTEQQIYDMQIVPFVQRHVGPHAVEVAARWAVLTRLRRPDPGLYPERVRAVVDQLSAAAKSELYAVGRVPTDVRGERAEELRASIPAMYRESDDGPEYEGRHGASPREIRALLFAASNSDVSECLSPLAVLAEIRALSARKAEHEFLRRETLPGGYDAPSEVIDVVHEAILDRVEEELRTATGLVAEERHAELFERYVLHVRHWVEGEKVPNKVTGTDENPDIKLMTHVEEKLRVPAKEGEEFRRALISAIAGYAIEHPGVELDLSKVFPDHMSALRASYYAEHRERVARVGRDLLALLSDEPIKDADAARAATRTADALRDRFGYCRGCAREMIADLMRKRYDR